MTKLATVEQAKGLTTAELAAGLSIDRGGSDLVAVDEHRLERVIQHLSAHFGASDYAPARWDDPLFWNVEATDVERSQYFAIGCAINFRFWRLEGKTLKPASGSIDGESFRGAMYMWRCLRRALDSASFEILDANSLASLSEQEFDAIFANDDGVNPLAVAKEDRIANLRNLGDELLAEWDGQFFNLVCACAGSLKDFARLCGRVRAFDDPVYKLTMVNAILHSGSDVYRFRDEPLPAIDYHLLRQALRQGIIRPVPALMRKLTSMETLAPYEAQELRRIALAAFLAISEATGISGELLDNRFWLNRINCSDEPVCLDPETADQCPFLAACERRVEFALPIETTRYY